MIGSSDVRDKSSYSHGRARDQVLAFVSLFFAGEQETKCRHLSLCSLLLTLEVLKEEMILAVN
uniref:Uncharacterized protein MANES_01G073400 n=1 Tax=Rhizophora mucronata TaxID=61149 RepID=A0A2P2L0Q3_RHIMU